MPRKRAADPSPRRVSLHITDSSRDAWRDVIRPWCKRVAAAAWQQELPPMIVAPTRGQINALRTAMVEEGLSQLGLHFITAPALRALFRRDVSEKSASAADLRLLLAIAASQPKSQPNESESLTAKAVARSAGTLLRALERLGRAGWNFQDMQMPAFAPIVQDFTTLRQTCGLPLAHESERNWLDRARKRGPQFGDVLITGFDGAHWSHWILLQALVAAAQQATVVLEEPRGDLSDVDLCWIGSWEEIGGEVQRTIPAGDTNAETLFTEAEMRGRSASAAQFDFLVGTNAAEQAEAIAFRCAAYLTDKNCTRIGIVFPANGALPRLVGNNLARLSIPHNDGIGHAAPGLFESNEWRAWVELQRAPRVRSLLNFVNTFADPTTLLGDKLSRLAFEEALQRSYSEVLLDDLDVLRQFCATHSKGSFVLAAEALGRIAFLPAEATLRQFVDATSSALNTLSWQHHAFAITSAVRDWADRFDTKFSRAFFLRWLDETATSFGLSRAPIGNHPYARVQLLAVADAQSQEWSHLIFAGCNEGEWPPPMNNDFAREEEIRTFNRSVQQLNSRAARRGSQGEGHTSVQEDHALYLGPIEQRAIALRQFDALIDSTTASITIAASLVHEDAPERTWNPSECFAQRYLENRHEPLNERALKELQRATAAWVDKARSITNEEKQATDVQQTLVAFNARRDASVPAGEYDFALRTDHSYRFVPELSVSDLEAMVATPALVWMKRYLGVAAPDDLSNPWAATSGKWVHRWLAQIRAKDSTRLFVLFPSAAAIDEQVCRSADERSALLKGLCDSLGKQMPDWWTSGWLNARYLARHLGAKIATADGWKWLTTELPVGRDSKIDIAPGVNLQLRGQIDLVLAQDQSGEFAGQKLWVIDYKTGSTKELKDSDLHDSLVKGTTLQLGLYALALRQLGASEVAVSIVSLFVKRVAPQLSAADLEPHTNVFADLAEMQRTGVFGMKGEIRPAFGYSNPYPLATLPIDRDILEDKWALSHENLVLEKEESESWI